MSFPVGKCHFRSENVISGRKMSFSVGKCHFRSEHAIFSRKRLISCRKMPFSVKKAPFPVENVILGRKSSISSRKMTIPVNYFLKNHPVQSFPFISVSSPLFICSCLAFGLKHWVALRHFSNNYVPFDEVVGYFIVCCWVLPFTILISTTAGDNVLPYTNNSSGHNDVLSHYYTAHSKKTRSSFLKYIEIFKEKFMPYRTNRHLY